MSYLLFDIGGTKMRFAVTEDCVECSDPVVVKTPDTYEASLELIAQTARELSAEITHAVGGVAGTFNKLRDVLVSSPNNPDWVGKPLRDDLRRVLGVDVEIENDTAVIALGEAVFGAGKGFDIVGYMTVSTGVGGSRVVYGKMDSKARSFEPGHQIISSVVDMDEYDTLENRVSGTAMKKRFGKEGYEITDKHVWDTVTKELAVGVHNTLLHWSPDIMILGGSMITGNGPCVPMDALCENITKLSPTLFKTCGIKRAELGDINGIYGALAWARQKNS